MNKLLVMLFMISGITAQAIPKKTYVCSASYTDPKTKMMLEKSVIKIDLDKMTIQNVVTDMATGEVQIGEQSKIVHTQFEYKRKVDDTGWDPIENQINLYIHGRASTMLAGLLRLDTMAFEPHRLNGVYRYTNGQVGTDRAGNPLSSYPCVVVE